MNFDNNTIAIIFVGIATLSAIWLGNTEIALSMGGALGGLVTSQFIQK